MGEANSCLGGILSAGADPFNSREITVAAIDRIRDTQIVSTMELATAMRSSNSNEPGILDDKEGLVRICPRALGLLIMASIDCGTPEVEEFDSIGARLEVSALA